MYWFNKTSYSLDVSDRVNAAIIAGHEEDVGKRTSVYVHTAHSLTQSLMINKKRGFTQIPTDKVRLNHHLFLYVGCFDRISNNFFGLFMEGH